MSKRHKRLLNWKNNTPVTVPIDEIRAVIDYFLKDNWRMDGTSHLTVFHDDLKQHQKYKPYGELSIPCSGGQRVKGVYIKKFIEFIEALGFWNEEEEE